MKRWHVLAPNGTFAKALYNDFRAAGIEPGHIHLFAKDHAVIIDAGLPEPTAMEEAMVSGQGIGSFLSGLMGTASPDPRIKDYEVEIAAGGILLVVIVPKKQVAEMEALIERHKKAWSQETAETVRA